MKKITEKFLQPNIPPGFYWFNEPEKYSVGAGLEIYTNEKTDFWQKTHYGFSRDDGHCLFTRLEGDFAITTHVEFEPQNQYDQGGLMVRADNRHWLKTSVEYEDAAISRLGSVVTNLGFSDWATQDIPAATTAMWYRLNKKGEDFLIESSFDGAAWQQMRVAHLHYCPPSLEVGVYACSPIGAGFRCRFLLLQIEESDWA
ncbi:MAG: DUF1349 domain-containing protein [Anaerolineae bacterium]|nr:DUF1349 domain-containing protein [Anaerolineae bacterium]